MKHTDDATLLELCYLPDENREAAAHVAECSACGQRLETMRNAISAAASSASGSDRADAFWRRQRSSIMSRIEEPAPAIWSTPLFRFAVAAMLVLVTGGSLFLIGRPDIDPAHPVAVVSTAAVSPVASGAPVIELMQLETTVDPWASGELSDFRSVVDWESWEHPAGSGGTL